MTVDLELVDKLVKRVDISSKPALARHPLVIDYSALRGAVGGIQASFEKNNPAGIVKCMSVHGKFVSLPIFGRFGELIHAYRLVNQNVSEKIGKHFEKYMPAIFKGLKEASSNVSAGSRAISGVVKAFDKSVTDLEVERDIAIAAYVKSRQDYDSSGALMGKANAQFDEMQTLVAESDHNTDAFETNLMRRDGLEVTIATCEEEMDVCSAEITKQGIRRGVTQRNVVRYISIRKDLKLYLKLAEVYQAFIADNLREGELTAGAIVSLAIFMDGLAEASGKMVSFGKYDSSARTVMESLFKVNLLATQSKDELQAYSTP